MSLAHTLLLALAEAPRTGAALQADLGLEPAAFKEAARSLWADGLIQGMLSDGCCSAPCGTMCVSAMKPKMVWQPSKKGRLRLKVLAAKAEAGGA